MASDLSSECTETIGVLDEKEEGEISLEDVSSSEEGHLNYGYGTKVSHCSNCSSSQHNAAWCSTANKLYPKGSNRREVDLVVQDAVQGKENRHQVKESGCIAAKHTVSTLQEKNDDLVPISSDSDMEIVGLADNSKRIIVHASSKNRVKKKTRKKRNHLNVLKADDFVSPSTVDIPVTDCVNTLKHEMSKTIVKPSHREVSPVHRNRPRLIPRSPPRKHISLARARSPFKRSKSPKRSPYRSLAKPMPKKTSHSDLTSSHNYVDTHKLLKRVRELDSIGTHSLEETLNKNKEHASSLKDKLTNMMKGVSDNNSDVTDSLKDKSTKHLSKKESNDADDEEDLALLRQKALETKQNKPTKQNDQSKTENSKIDDQDEEDLELRMIALRSAVLKKHQNRIQKGMKSGKYTKCKVSRSESPFTQSFLDSIPIPGEELVNFASPPHTPVSLSENNHTEDLPYSPTDKITSNIPIDTELLGIEPSDVSFINFTEANSNQNFNKSLVSCQDDEKSYQGKIIENRSYLPNTMYYTSQNSSCPTTASMQYVTENSGPRFINVHNPDRNLHHYENTCSVSKNNNTSEFADINSSQEIPYSPTDTPVYDPDLSQALPQTCGPLNTSSSSLISLEPYSPNTCGNTEQYNRPQAIPYTSITKQEKHKNEGERLNKEETVPLDPVVGPGTTSIMGSVLSPNSMVTVDGLTKVGTNPSPLTESVRNIKSTECIPRNLPTNNNSKGMVSEPFYMKGVPDVTKDTNKIPTLINRTLVPAPIWRSNKQLQVPLSTKKCTMQQEPIFKSADMQPVMINEESNTKMNISFKPIKLTSFAQKANSVLIIPTAFHDSLQEDTAPDIALNKTHPPPAKHNRTLTLIQPNITKTNSDTTCDIKNPLQNKKKLLKKGLKRKGTGSISLAAKKCNISDTNSDNTNILDGEKHESNKDVNINNNQNVQESQQEPNSKDGTLSVMLDNLKTESSVETNKQGYRTGELSQQLKEAENRRQSLDEDEEALRAILLASLPKRTKTINNIPKSDVTVTSVTLATTTTSIMSNTTVIPSISNATSVPNETVTNQTASKVALAGVNITNTTNVHGSTSLPISHITSHGLKNHKSDNNAGEQVNILQKNSAVENSKISNSIASERKRSVPIPRGPQKKLVKRISIPASTKVVNNAKKYQNTMIQKKLNLQKATLYNKQKVTENKIVSKFQSYDTKNSVNTKTLSDTQRIIINLNSDTESDSESERQKAKAASIVHSVIMENQQSAANSTDFEKNLDQFLRAVRKKQESMAAARPTSLSQTPKKDTVLLPNTDKSNSSNLHTPLAVRHLPASQQEEYRRLKQQILEREKLKLHRTSENSSTLKNKSVSTSSKSTVPNSPTKDLGAKVNQTISGKHTQSISAQLDKENFSKNLVDSIKNVSVSTSNVQLCSDKMYNTERQGSASLSHIKTISRPIENLHIHVSTDNDTKNNNSNNTQSISTSRINFESPISSAQLKTKTPPGLKILSSDEVNQKYVKIQVKSYANKRVVTINDKVTLNDETLNKRNENISVNKDSNVKSICDSDINQIMECVEQDVITNHTAIGNNNMVDSDASTIILPHGNQNTEKDDSFDTSESTIRLSEYQDDSCMSSISNAEGKDDSHFLLFKNNMSPNSTRSIEENWEAIRKDVKTELNTLINLSQVEQEQRLMDTEQKLVMKRYTILDDLAEMSGNLRQWHMERDLQTHLAAEVKKLREQLKVAEERLQVQRNRINSIGPKVITAHGRINAGRQECFKLATICSTLGNRVIGKEYKVPEAGALLLDNRIKEVANHTRQLSRKKVPSIDITDTHDFSRLGEDTIITTCTEMSQTESLLPEICSVGDIDATILKDDFLINSAKKERAVQENVTAENPQRKCIEEEMVSSNSVPSDNARSTPKENSTERDVSSEQTTISDTSIASASALNVKDTQDLDNMEASESNTVKPAPLDPDSKKKNFASSDGEFQMKKTLLPYESILAHFKLARNANPNGILCPYELMGTCSDGDCQFVHQTENQAK